MALCPERNKLRKDSTPAPSGGSTAPIPMMAIADSFLLFVFIIIFPHAYARDLLNPLPRVKQFLDRFYYLTDFIAFLLNPIPTCLPQTPYSAKQTSHFGSAIRDTETERPFCPMFTATYGEALL